MINIDLNSLFSNWNNKNKAAIQLGLSVSLTNEDYTLSNDSVVTSMSIVNEDELLIGVGHPDDEIGRFYIDDVCFNPDGKNDLISDDVMAKLSHYCLGMEVITNKDPLDLSKGKVAIVSGIKLNADLSVSLTVKPEYDSFESETEIMSDTAVLDASPLKCA
jgi:hypothetical protein